MSSFNNLPVVDMPTAIVETPYYRQFSETQYKTLQQGYRPRGTDDRWFIYLKDHWLYVHRSWTGFCVFKVNIADENGSYISTILQINRDVDQYKSTNIESDIAELNSVLNSIFASI